MPDARDNLAGLGAVLQWLRFASMPVNRVADHFMRADMHDVFRFAYSYPEAVRAVELEDGVDAAGAAGGHDELVAA